MRTKFNKIFICFALLVICPLLAQENKLDEKTKVSTEIDFLFEDIESGFNANDEKEIFSKFDILFEEHLFDKGVMERVFDYVENKGEDFQVAWSKHYGMEVDRFLRDGYADRGMLLKSKYSNKEDVVYNRLMTLMVENRQVVDLFRILDLSFRLGLKVDREKWLKKINILASNLEDPTVNYWLRTGPYSEYLNAETKELLKKKQSDQGSYGLMTSLKGFRPSPRVLWSSAIAQVKEVKAAAPTKKHFYYSPRQQQPYMNDKSPQHSHSFVKHVVNSTATEKTLWAYDKETGLRQWREEFTHRQGLTLSSYDSIDGAFDQLDVLGWMQEAGFERRGAVLQQGGAVQQDSVYETDFIMRDSVGRLIWKRVLTEVVEENENVFLASKPIRNGGQIFVAVYSVFSNGAGGFGGNSNIKMSLYLLSLSVNDGTLLWKSDLDFLQKKLNHSNYNVKSKVQLLCHSGAVWVETGTGLLVALEKDSGHFLLKNNVNKGQQASNNHFSYNRKQILNEGYKGFKEQFFFRWGNHMLCRSLDGNMCNIFESHSGKVKDSIKLNNGLIFLGQIKEGLLFYDKKGFVLYSNLNQGKLKIESYPVNNIPKIKSIIPWGNGCLVSDGKSLCQVDFRKTKKGEMIDPQFVMLLNDRYKTVNGKSVPIKAVGNDLFAYCDRFLDKIFLWPDDPEKLKKNWLEEKKDFDLLLVLLRRALEKNEWKVYQDLLDQSKKEVYRNQDFLSIIVGKGLKFQLKGEKEKADWLYKYVQSSGEDGGDIARFVTACLRGENPSLESRTFKVGRDYYLGAESLKIFLWNLSGESQNIPAHLKDLSVYKNLSQHFFDRQLSPLSSDIQPLEEGLVELIGDDIAMVEGQRKYYRISTGTYIDFPQKVSTWAWNRVFYVDKGKLNAMKWDEDKFVEQWSCDLSSSIAKKTTTTKPIKKNNKGKKNNKRSGEFMVMEMNDQKYSSDDLSAVHSIRSGAIEFFVREPFLLLKINSNLLCLDSEKGFLLWKRKFDRVLYSDSFRFDGSDLYMASELEEEQIKLDDNNIRHFIARQSISPQASSLEKIKERIDRIAKLNLMTGSLVWETNVDAPRVSSFAMVNGAKDKRRPQVQMMLSEGKLYVFSEDKWQRLDLETGKIQHCPIKPRMYNNFRIVRDGKYFLFDVGNGRPSLTTKMREDKQGNWSCGKRLPMYFLPKNGLQSKFYAVIGDELFVASSDSSNTERIFVQNIITGKLAMDPEKIVIEDNPFENYSFGEAKVVGGDIYFPIYNELIVKRQDGRVINLGYDNNDRRKKTFSLYRCRKETTTEGGKISHRIVTEKIKSNVKSFHVGGSFVNISAKDGQFAYFYTKK